MTLTIAHQILLKVSTFHTSIINTHEDEMYANCYIEALVDCQSILTGTDWTSSGVSGWKDW
jgi:hypothetical protein